MTIYRDFCSLSGTCRIPDRVGILRFRHLLEDDGLSPRILRIINDKLSMQGPMFKTGTLVDATLVAAPTFIKNEGGERDPEMHPDQEEQSMAFWNEGPYRSGRGIGAGTDGRRHSGQRQQCHPWP